MVSTNLCGGASGDLSTGLWPWCCCDTCCIIRDKFDGDELSSSWTTSDTWTVADGAASATANDQAIHTYEHSDANLVVDMLIYATADTEFLLTFDHSGGSYKYIKVVTDDAFNSGQLIYGTSGGGDAITLSATIYNNTEYIVRYCYDGTTMIGNVFDMAGEPVASIADDLTYSNVKVGMGFGSVSGSPEIRHFYASDYGVTDCVECVDPRACPTCDGDFTPAQIRLTISGVTGGANCSGALCDSWNGTYIYNMNRGLGSKCGGFGASERWPVSDGFSGPCVTPYAPWGAEIRWYVNQPLPPPFDAFNGDYVLVDLVAPATGPTPTSFCGDSVQLFAVLNYVSGSTFPCFVEFDGKSIFPDLTLTDYQYEDGCTSGNSICNFSAATFRLDALMEQ